MTTVTSKIMAQTVNGAVYCSNEFYGYCNPAIICKWSVGGIDTPNTNAAAQVDCPSTYSLRSMTNSCPGPVTNFNCNK